jgi:hypothetical protein
MSLEVLLIPAAIAAYAAWQAHAEAGTKHCRVETRWRHSGLLMQALHDLPAADISSTSDSTTATINGIATSFSRRADGIMTAHFPLGTSVDAAMDVVNQVDAAYTRRVQDAVYRRIRSRVQELGYELASETVDDDETITLVVNAG